MKYSLQFVGGTTVAKEENLTGFVINKVRIFLLGRFFSPSRNCVNVIACVFHNHYSSLSKHFLSRYSRTAIIKVLSFMQSFTAHTHTHTYTHFEIEAIVQTFFHNFASHDMWTVVRMPRAAPTNPTLIPRLPVDPTTTSCWESLARMFGFVMIS
jgi:hypothetical protein